MIEFNLKIIILFLSIITFNSYSVYSTGMMATIFYHVCLFVYVSLCLWRSRRGKNDSNQFRQSTIYSTEYSCRQCVPYVLYPVKSVYNVRLFYCCHPGAYDTMNNVTGLTNYRHYCFLLDTKILHLCQSLTSQPHPNFRNSPQFHFTLDVYKDRKVLGEKIP